MNTTALKIKIAMLRNGRDDFTIYLGEILGITKQASSLKLLGKVNFSEADREKIKAEIGDFEKEYVKENGEE